jgi:hypothetical protein
MRPGAHHSSPLAPACFNRRFVTARFRPPVFVSFLSIAARFTVLLRALFCGLGLFLLVAFFVRVAMPLLLPSTAYLGNARFGKQVPKPTMLRGESGYLTPSL